MMNQYKIIYTYYYPLNNSMKDNFLNEGRKTECR